MAAASGGELPCGESPAFISERADNLRPGGLAWLPSARSDLPFGPFSANWRVLAPPCGKRPRPWQICPWSHLLHVRGPIVLGLRLFGQRLILAFEPLVLVVRRELLLPQGTVLLLG